MGKSASGAMSYIAMTKQDPATPRVIPATPVMQKVNFTDDSLGTDIKTTKSDHVRPDRMIADVTVTGFTVGGGYNFEHQFENSKDDELLAGFLWNNWGAPIAAADLTGGTVTAAGVLDLSGAATKPTLVLGQSIKISGTGNSGENDNIYTIVSTTAADIYTVVPHPAADETLASGAVADGSTLSNGNVYFPFFIERGHTDVNQYFKYTGMSCDKMTLEFKDQSKVVGSYDFMGLQSKVDPVIETGATYVDATTNPVFSTVTNIKNVLIDGVVQEGCFIKELTLEVTNNLTSKTGLGILGACETKAHAFEVSGNITMYFEDATMYNKLLNGTAFSLQWTEMDSNGHGYTFSVPRAKLDKDTINVKGKDDDVMDNASFIGLADNVTKCALRIDKF